MKPTTALVLVLASLVLISCGGGGTDDESSASVRPQGGSTNNAPVANAGVNQNVKVGDRVRLDGSASRDSNNDPLTYRWSLATRPAGSGATLSSLSDPLPTFVTDIAGTYIASLVVNDGRVDSAPATVFIAAAAQGTNAPPTANAGESQSVSTGSTVTLNGRGSFDPDGNPLTYRWSLTSRPGGSSATLSSTVSVRPSFVADMAGIYVLALIVNDGKTDSAPATVLVTAATNAPPIANAGTDRTVAVGTRVTLDGKASSDANGDPLSYSWILSKPSGSLASLSNGSGAEPSFTADVAGTFVAVLIVNDGNSASGPDAVVINAVAAPPPTSPDGTSISSGGGGQIVDSNGNIWTISPDGRVVVNGILDNNTSEVIGILWYQGKIWHEDAPRDWWRWDPGVGRYDGWTGPLDDPRIYTPPSLTESQVRVAEIIEREVESITTHVLRPQEMTEWINLFEPLRARMAEFVWRQQIRKRAIDSAAVYGWGSSQSRSDYTQTGARISLLRCESRESGPSTTIRYYDSVAVVDGMTITAFSPLDWSLSLVPENSVTYPAPSIVVYLKIELDQREGFYFWRWSKSDNYSSKTYDADIDLTGRVIRLHDLVRFLTIACVPR